MEHVRSLIAGLPGEDFHGGGIQRFGRASNPVFQTSSSELAYKREFEEMLEAMASAAQSRRSAIMNSNSAALEGYADLVRLYRILQIMIRVRSELQRALNISE